MSQFFRFRPNTFIVALAAALSFTACATLGGEVIGKWNIDIGLSINREQQLVAVGELIRSKDNQYLWRMNSPRLNVCDVGGRRADVQTESGKQIITVEKTMQDCPTTRYLIGSDGLGTVEYLQDGKWRRSAWKVLGAL